MAEKRDIEINSRADTIDLMNPEIRPWPVTRDQALAGHTAAIV